MSRRLHAAAIALVLNAASAAAEDARTQSPCSPIIQNARGNVSVTFSGGCTTGITPEQLREIIDSIQVGRAIPAELLDRYERLSQRFGVTDTAVKNFFQLLGEQNVASEDLDSRLRQV